MPELPEVETARRFVEHRALGHTSLRAEVADLKMLEGGMGDLSELCCGSDLIGTARHGKNLFLDLGRGFVHIHLGMSGSLHFLGAGDGRTRHERFRMVMDHGSLVLDDVAPPEGVLFPLLEPKGLGEGPTVAGYNLEGGQNDCLRGEALRLRAITGSPDIPDPVWGSTSRKSLGDLEDRLFSHAENEEVGLAVHEDGPPDAVGPIVIVGEPPEARLDAAYDERDVLPGLPGPVAVDYRRPLGSPSGPAAG